MRLRNYRGVTVVLLPLPLFPHAWKGFRGGILRERSHSASALAGSASKHKDGTAVRRGTGGGGGRVECLCNERKDVPVEISRRKLSAAIVRHRLSVRRGRKMRYEMKRRPPPVLGWTVDPRGCRRDKGAGGGRACRWSTRVKEAHIKRATSATWKRATEGIASSSLERLPLNFSSLPSPLLFLLR